MRILNNLFAEICKISTMHATSALSKFLNTPVAVDLRPVEIKEAKDVSFFMKPDDVVVNVFMEIKGPLKGGAFILWSQKAAHSMCEALYHRPLNDTRSFREEEISALAEVANIIIGNFLTSFAQALEIDALMHRAPEFECSEFKKIEQHWITKAVQDLKELIVDISFIVQHVHVTGYVVILLEEKDLEARLNSFPEDTHSK